MVLLLNEPTIKPAPLRMAALCCGAVAASELRPEPCDVAAEDTLPAEADFILSALEAAHAAKPRLIERRETGRMAFRAVARLRLFCDLPGAEPWMLYSRDATTRSLGFITRHRLPLGYGGVVTLVGPDQREIKADCVLHRCRETVSDWFEGSLTFNREQWALGCDC
jgi:hypothetical protein